MRIKKAYWASLALIPATIVPLSTTTSCSQAWGFKTPLSIGSSIKGSQLDPFADFADQTDLVDLNGEAIVSQLQSNYAIDVKSNNYYGYSLPQKWDSNKEVKPDEVVWDKGDFVDASAGWYDYSSSDFIKSATREGKRTKDSARVAEQIYSYRNNTLSSNIQLVGVVGTSISSTLNYALQYQGTQIGTQWASATETDTNLATSWGGNITHGDQGSDTNREFYEGIFAANAVSGTGKATAALHPTHVEFKFNESTFPVPAYVKENNEIVGVSDATLRLLNGDPVRPSQVTTGYRYWTTESDKTDETVRNIRTGEDEKYTYKVYTYENVPVIVDFLSLSRAFVNPTKNDSYIVSDFYSDTKAINETIGTSWEQSLPKFATDATKPSFSAYTYQTPVDSTTARKINPKYAEAGHDTRIDGKVKQNSYIVLLNYAYKEYEGHKEKDRVTMTGLNTLFPAYLIDTSVNLGEDTFFKVASTDSKITNKGQIFDSNKVNKYANLLYELLKRSSGQGLVTQAKDLNDTSKNLLKILNFMFGYEQSSTQPLVVDTSKIITAYKLK